MGLRILDLQECIRHDGLKMWMEMREMPGQTVPVVFYSERIPFLRFDAQDRVLMISVRADYYGKTWRCWDAEPGKTDWGTAGTVPAVPAERTKPSPGSPAIQVMTREEHADLHSAGRKKKGKKVAE